MEIGTNFWFLSDFTEERPFRGDVLWANAYDYNPKTQLSKCSPWNPVFLDEVRWYKVLRFMDWNKTNKSREKHWDNRTKPWRNQPRVGNRGVASAGLAYEWQIDLANRIGADIWINIPLRATEPLRDDTGKLKRNPYVANLARLLRNKVRPELKIYIELHNEIWNSKPIHEMARYQKNGTTNYGRDQARRLRIADNNATDLQNAYRWYIHQSVGIWKTFKQVFEERANAPNWRTRVRPIVAGQNTNLGVGTNMLAYLKDPELNPPGNRIMPYAYAVAPYFQMRGAGTEWQRIDRSIRFVVDMVEENYKIWKRAGIKLIAYEGGQHLAGPRAAILNRENKNRDMQKRYDRLLRGLEPYLDLFTHYVHAGRFNDRWAWGAKEHTGQPMSQAPKYRSLFRYANGNRQLPPAKRWKCAAIKQP